MNAEEENLTQSYPVGSTWKVKTGGKYGCKFRERTVVEHRSDRCGNAVIMFSQMSEKGTPKTYRETLSYFDQQMKRSKAERIS